MKIQRKWTEEEEKLFQNSTDQEIAILTGRKVNAVAAKRNYMSTQEKIRNRRKPWTEREMDIIRSNPSNVQVAKFTGRTVISVQTKRKLLKSTDRALANTSIPAPRAIGSANNVFVICALGTFEINPNTHSGVVISNDGITFKPRK